MAFLLFDHQTGASVIDAIGVEPPVLLIAVVGANVGNGVGGSVGAKVGWSVWILIVGTWVGANVGKGVGGWVGDRVGTGVVTGGGGQIGIAHSHEQTHCDSSSWFNSAWTGVCPSVLPPTTFLTSFISAFFVSLLAYGLIRISAWIKLRSKIKVERKNKNFILIPKDNKNTLK